MLSEEEWFKFANGGYGHPVEVGRLRPALVRYLGVETGVVRISPAYAHKLRFKHRLTPYQFTLMGPTIEQGKILSESANRLIFYRFFEHIESFMQLVLKPTADGRELWVCTFHKQTEREIARKSKKCLALDL